jgi:hypothetical protein
MYVNRPRITIIIRTGFDFGSLLESCDWKTVGFEETQKQKLSWGRKLLTNY